MMISSSIRLAIIGAVGKTMIYQFHAEAVEDLEWALTLLQMARGVLEPKEETDASFALKGNTLRRTFEARLRLSFAILSQCNGILIDETIFKAMHSPGRLLLSFGVGVGKCPILGF